MKTPCKACEKMRSLLREVMLWHCDEDAPEFNNCVKDPCCWCENARKALALPCECETNLSGGVESRHAVTTDGEAGNHNGHPDQCPNRDDLSGDIRGIVESTDSGSSDPPAQNNLPRQLNYDQLGRDDWAFRRVIYDPAKHGDVEYCEPGDELWFWGTGE